MNLKKNLYLRNALKYAFVHQSPRPCCFFQLLGSCKVLKSFKELHKNVENVKIAQKTIKSFSWIFCFVYHYFKLTAFRLHVPTVCPLSPPNSNNFQGVFLLEFAILCNSRMLSSLNLGKTLLKRTRILAAPTSLLSTAELGYKRRPQEGQLSSQQLNFAIVASSVPRLPVCIRSEKTYNLKSHSYIKKKTFRQDGFSYQT